MDNAVGTPADNSTWLSGMSMKGDKEQEIVMEQKAKDVMSSKLDSDNDANSGKFRSPLAGIWVSEADERRNQNQKADDSEVEVLSAELVGKMKTTMGEAAQEVKARPTKYLKFIVFGAGSALVSALFRSVLYSVGELPVLQDGLELVRNPPDRRKLDGGKPFFEDCVTQYLSMHFGLIRRKSFFVDWSRVYFLVYLPISRISRCTSGLCGEGQEVRFRRVVRQFTRYCTSSGERTRFNDLRGTSDTIVRKVYNDFQCMDCKKTTRARKTIASYCLVEVKVASCRGHYPCVLFLDDFLSRGSTAARKN
mmetsp:Transcript_10162/g.42616  ORF Transcript_10162/g.42616 Transcript_10162/m.42616 type:complete len:307 (+) Transcript_10162:367-1287(+)